MARKFLDTNVFFYSIDTRDPAKQAKARALIADLVNSGEGVVSTQVIQEFANNAIKKLAFTPDEAMVLCEALADHTIVKLDLDLISSALRLMGSASISFWDGCIVAAAHHAQCKVLYTEDLSSGQRIGGLKILNPFL